MTRHRLSTIFSKPIDFFLRAGNAGDMGRPPTNLPRVTFRFPEVLRDQLEEAAKENNRSVNAEVVARLERTFAEAADLEGFDVQQEVKRHHSWMVVMMQALSQSDDKAFDPVRDVLDGMDKAGKKAAVEWFRDNEGRD